MQNKIYLHIYIYLFGHMNEFDIASRHHEIIVWMVFSTLIDEHDVRQGDVHETANRTEIDENKQWNRLCLPQNERT